MRTLILLRHAPAEAAGRDGADLERPLSERGRREAEDAGRWLAGTDWRPERVLCSPALRTRQTLDVVAAQLGGLDAIHDERIYEATPGELLQVIDDHPRVGTLLLVGHNPGLEQLVALLTSGQSGDHRGMPPAGIAVLAFEDNVVEPAAARLLEFWSP